MKRWLWLLLLIALPAAAQTHTYPALDTNNSFTGVNTFCSQNGIFNLNPGCYAGDIGAQINTVVSQCTFPQGCLINIPPGLYAYSTPITVTGFHGPITLNCTPGGARSGNAYTTELHYTGATGVALTWGAGANGVGISGCVLFGDNPTNPTTGLKITTQQGGLFSNLDISGFGTGMDINTTPGQVYIDTFNNFYVHNNTINLNNTLNDGATNENVTFNGGYFTGESYSATCMNLANFEYHFNYVSFDSCPITIQGGANSHFSFYEAHFEFTKGGTTMDAISVAAGCAACELTVMDPEIIEDQTGSGRTEFFSIAGTGTYTFIAPQIFAHENVQAIVTKSNAGATVQVQSPFLLGSPGLFSEYVFNTITNTNDFGLVGVTGNPTNGYYQSVRDTAGCTTPASVGASCASDITIVWPTPWPDTNYSATCTGRGVTNVPGPVYIVSKGVNQLVFNYQSVTGGAAAWTVVDCVGIHD